MTNKQTTPLWRELNEKRTQGNWQQDDIFSSVFGYEVTDNSGNTIGDFYKNSYYRKRENGREIGKANAAYAALAVNNLHKLAEALEWIQNEIKTTPDELADALQGVILIKIKQTLAAIS